MTPRHHKPTAARHPDIQHLSYQPEGLYPLDLEIFRVSDLRQRVGGEALASTYRYAFPTLIDPLAGCARVGNICQLGGFRISVSICQPAAWHAGHHRHLACNLRARHPLASTCLHGAMGCVD